MRFLRQSVRLALALVAALAFANARAGTGELVELMDNLVRQGDESPTDAIDSLYELANKDFASAPQLRRVAITSIGIIEARNGQQLFGVIDSKYHAAMCRHLARTNKLTASM